jgi:DNA-binding transcriptional ArsR family regulator
MRRDVFQAIADPTRRAIINMIAHESLYKNKSIFKEIIVNKKIVYDYVSGPKFVATINFEERGEQTFITWHMLFETAEEFIQTVKNYKADEGLKQNLVKLENYLLII